MFTNLKKFDNERGISRSKIKSLIVIALLALASSVVNLKAQDDLTAISPSLGGNTQHIVDFNGDGKTDFAVARNTGGGPNGQLTWFVQNNGGSGLQVVPWGIAGDSFVPEDYDGDGKTDIAVWRPGAPNAAAFYILQSQTNTVKIQAFGQTGDDPTVVGDYDGDGKADMAVFRLSTQSVWYFRGTLNNPNGNITYVPWGADSDFPAPGDYDGDGKHDFVVQRDNGDGQARFWMFQTTAGFNSVPFGRPNELIVTGDFDGDGKNDLAVLRGDNGALAWFVRPSSTGIVSAAPMATFGSALTDFAAPGDYDGDGKTDFAVWRRSPTPGASAFWVQGSTVGVFTIPFGTQGDYPVANYNTH